MRHLFWRLLYARVSRGKVRSVLDTHMNEHVDQMTKTRQEG